MTAIGTTKFPLLWGLPSVHEGGRRLVRHPRRQWLIAIAAAMAYPDPLTLVFQPHDDLVVAPVTEVGRLIPQRIVGVEIVGNRLQVLVPAIGVEHRLAAGLFGHHLDARLQIADVDRIDVGAQADGPGTDRIRAGAG